MGRPMKDILSVLSSQQPLTKANFTLLRHEACESKPAHLNLHSKEIAVRYDGDQVAVLKTALQQRFPRTWQRFPIAPVNWLKFFAQQDSGVYVQPTDRELDGLEEPDPRAEAFERAVEDLQLDGVMAEVEQRTLAGVHSVAVLLGWQQVAADGQTTLPFAQVYWPHQIEVVADEDAPGQQEALVCVMLQQGAGEDATWWVWKRERLALGQYGPWVHCRYSESEEGSTAWETYLGKRLPIVFFRVGQPIGFFPKANGDVVAQVDSLNVSKSNETYVVELQAHAQPVYKGNQLEAAQIAVGPDEAVKIGPEEDLSYLTAGADFTAMRESRNLALKEVAISRRASADSYSPSSQAPQSGVSRQIANIPHDQQVERLKPLFKQFEERHLLPLLCEIIEVFGDANVNMAGVKPVIEYGVTSYESETEKLDKKAKQQAIVKEQLDAGLITKARAAIELDLYPTIDDAVAAGLSNSLGTPASGGSILDLIAQAPAAVPTEGNQ